MQKPQVVSLDEWRQFILDTERVCLFLETVSMCFAEAGYPLPRGVASDTDTWWVFEEATEEYVHPLSGFRVPTAVAHRAQCLACDRLGLEYTLVDL